jgi:uncharacterized repeat protein (TIGR02543 family)
VAAPSTGYTFVNWTEDGTPISFWPSCTFTATSNRTLVANFVQDVTTVTFDFDSGSPVLTNGQTTDFYQTSGGLTAHFSSSLDPAFAIQDDLTSGYALSRFSANYLFPFVPGGSLEIQFSRQLNSISLTFATLELPSLDPPASVQLTAYKGASGSAVGEAIAQGAFMNDSLPMGVVTLRSAGTFDRVLIQVAPTSPTATDVLVDNITVGVAPQLALWHTPTNTVVLAWPGPAPGYSLQVNSAPATANWTTATNTADLVGDQHQVVIAPPDGSQFYRLSR